MQSPSAIRRSGFSRALRAGSESKDHLASRLSEPPWPVSASEPGDARLVRNNAGLFGGGHKSLKHGISGAVASGAVVIDPCHVSHPEMEEIDDHLEQVSL